MSFAPVPQTSIAFSFVGGELFIYGLEWHEIDGCALNDAHRIAFAVEDDAQIACLWKWLIQRGVVHGQAGRSSLFARKYECCQFIGDFSFATKSEGIWLYRPPRIVRSEGLNELSPIRFAFGCVNRHG